MEPRIQYAKTKDGVSIAFWTLGEGMPLVYMQAQPFEHIQLEWGLPGARLEYEPLSQNRMVVRFDGRGSGLSQRDVTDFSLDARLLDLEAVVSRLGVEEIDLLGSLGSGPVAIAYAARHPERLSHLILWDTYARGRDFFETPQVQGLSALMEKDWKLSTETLGQAIYGWSGEPARRIAAYLRECVTPQVAKAAMDAQSVMDVTGLLPQVNTPTLVVQQSQGTFTGIDIARGLASGIPDARLAILEGDYTMDEAVQVQAIEEFLDEGKEAETASEELSADIVHTILFTDVEGSTALTDRLGDTKARELLREHERMVREALKTHGGSEVKTMGDGFMASFSSATKALECAIAMQRAFAQHNDSADEPIRVRVGLNAGEPIAEDDDLYGTAVNLAARICAHAESGQILAPIVVRELVAGKQFLFADLGETALRGYEDPVRLFEVRWRDG